MNVKQVFKTLAIASLLYGGLALNFSTAAKASSTLEIGQNADGRMETFAVGADKKLYFRYQTRTDGGWSNWLRTELPNGRTVEEVQVAHNVDGTMELFAISDTGEVFHKYQPQANSPMTAWRTFYFWADEIEVGMNQDGRLEVFGIERGTGNVYHRWQTRAKTSAGITSSWANWARMGGQATELEVARNADGRMELFAIQPNGVLVHRYQTGVNRPFSNQWNSLGLSAKDVEVGVNADGRLEIFAIKTDGSLVNRWQTAPSRSFRNGWNDLGINVTEVEVSTNKDGRQEIFAIRNDQRVMRRFQVAPNEGLSPSWIDTGVDAIEIDTAFNRSGRMEAIAIDSQGRARHQSQSVRANSNSWGSWHHMSNNYVAFVGEALNGASALHNNPTEQNPLRGFASPVRGGWTISQAPGGHFSHSSHSYYAIDFARSDALGQPVYAMRGGTVERIVQHHHDTGGGSANKNNVNLVTIRHENGYLSRYLHLQRNFNRDIGLQVGQQVSAGQLIGRVGNSGWSSGAHLHVDVKKGSSTVPFEIEGRFSF